MKILLLLCAIFSANAFASQQAADIYQILKGAGLSEKGNGVFHMDQEKIYGIYCHKNLKTMEIGCGLDRDDSTGNMIQITGANGKKMYELLAPETVACGEETCGFFVDAVQCDYTLSNSAPMSARTNCQVTTTKDL